jgi:hypothetical protein
MLKLDPLTHTYTLDGKRLPGVTEIIGRVIPRKFYASEFDLNKGSMVHRAAALSLTGDLDMDTVDDRIRGRVESTIKAVSQFNWQPFSVEQFMAHSLGFAGTPDLITQCGTLADWKGTIEACAEIQLGFYSLLCRENKINVKKLCAVKVQDSGEYKVEFYQQRRAEGLAMACFSMYGWMVKNKIGEV